MRLQIATHPGCSQPLFRMGYPGITYAPRRHSNTLVTKLSIVSLHSGQLRRSRAPISTARVQRLQVQRCPQGARMTALGRSRQMMQASSAGTSAHEGTGAHEVEQRDVDSQPARAAQYTSLISAARQLHMHPCIISSAARHSRRTSSLSPVPA